jgi:hypothetical protein
MVPKKIVLGGSIPAIESHAGRVGLREYAKIVSGGNLIRRSFRGRRRWR